MARYTKTQSVGCHGKRGFKRVHCIQMNGILPFVKCSPTTSLSTAAGKYGMHSKVGYPLEWTQATRLMGGDLSP